MKDVSGFLVLFEDLGTGLFGDTANRGFSMIKDNQPQTVKVGFIVLNRLITSARKDDFLKGIEVCLDALQLG